MKIINRSVLRTVKKIILLENRNSKNNNCSITIVYILYFITTIISLIINVHKNLFLIMIDNEHSHFEIVMDEEDNGAELVLDITKDRK